MKIKSSYIYAYLIFLILVAGFLLRLNFFLHRPQVPVVWDAAGYHIQGREFAAAFQSWPDREAFMEHFKKAYGMALPKCELYPLFISLVYLIAGIDFGAVRIAQGVLGTLSIFLLFLIAARVCNRRTAFISLLAGIIYVPFIISEGRLLTETLAVFVFLLTVWILVLTIRRGSWWLLLLSGFSTALMVITRTFFQYVYILYFPMLLAAGVAAGREPAPGRTSPGEDRLVRRLVRLIPWPSFFFLLGLAVIIVPRLFWTPQVDPHGRRFISGSWRNAMAMYCGIYPPNRGLQTVEDPGGEILRSIPAGRHPGAADDRYFQAYLRVLLEQPGEAIPVLLAKGWLFYQRAYNDFLQGYLIPPEWIDILNRLILIAGLFGAALLPARGRRAWPVIVSLFYGWAMCFAADVEARYALPVMPLMILAGAWFCDRALAGILPLVRPARGTGRRLLLPAAAPVILFVLLAAARPAFSLLVFPGLGFIAAHRLRVFLAALFLISLVPLLLRLYRPAVPGLHRLFAAVFPPAAILLVYLSALKVHPVWHQWQARLGDGGQVVRQTIVLPEDLTRYRSAELKLDLRSGSNRWYDLTISMDGEIIRRFEGGLSPDPDSWVPPVIRRAFPTYLRETRRTIADLPQWYTVPLDIRTLEGKGSVEVEIRFTPYERGKDCYVEVFGDYPTLAEPGVFEGPTLSKSPKKLAIYQYLINDDWRIWERSEISPVAAADYSGFGKSRDDDLSPSAGIQTGAFRVFLLLSRRDPPPAGFPVAVKRQEYLTEKTHLADYYNLQIWEVNNWKRKSNLFRLSAAHAAPGEEGGFRLVVYADTNQSKEPDLLVAESPYFTAETAGEWSSYTFYTAEKNIYVGMSWPQGSKTKVYYERALWPDDLFPQTMFYRPAPAPAIAGPVLTNMQLIFLEEESNR